MDDSRDPDGVRRDALAAPRPCLGRLQGAGDDSRARLGRTCIGLVLNVGDATANYQIRRVAEIVADVFPGCEVTIGTRGADQRSYRVSFDRIREALPEFSCDWNAERGVRELLEVFELVQLDSEDFLSRRFTRLKQIEYLLTTGQIDADFRWRHPRSRSPGLVSV